MFLIYIDNMIQLMPSGAHQQKSDQLGKLGRMKKKTGEVKNIPQTGDIESFDQRR